MKSLSYVLTIVLFAFCLPLAGQAPTYDEMEFEPDSLTRPYKPSGKNFALIRSKRGTDGVNKTATADAITSMEVTEIVLVFTENDPSDLANREEANRERWENLLKTYPDLFQFSTTYKNVCQCTTTGDAEALKKTQGFYVYVNGEVPQVEEPAVAAAPASTPPPKVEEKKPAAAPKTETPPPATSTARVNPTPAEKAPAVKETPAPVEKEAVKEPVKEVAKEPVKEAEPVATKETEEETPAPVAAKPAAKKKPATAKARRAKDPKACRQPCYGYGDEDLFAFFKDNITLTKKQKRKAKNWVANVRLQIHFDGSIKKTMVTGSEESFNKMVEDALKAMNNWNAAVKNGVAVKSEVRFNLKYDKASKTMRPADIMMNPKGSPKCPCVSDSEIFND